MDLKSWYTPLLGQRIDLDGAYPGECHDVGLSWMYALGVQPGDGHAPNTGYTDQVWRAFPNHRPRLAERFVKTTGTGSIIPGSLVYWSRYGPVGGLPHVAVAIEPPNGDTVLCVTQNPGPVKLARLSLTGVLGTLNPIGGGDQMDARQNQMLEAIYAGMFGPRNLQGANIDRVTWVDYDHAPKVAHYGILDIDIHTQALVSAGFAELKGQNAALLAALKQLTSGGGQIDMAALTAAAEKGAKSAVEALVLRASPGGKA